MIRNFIFDWSGTLADDLTPVFKATNLIFREYGKPALTLAEFRTYFRLPFSEFYAEFLPEATEEGLESLYERFFAGMHGEVSLLPGAVEMLDWCRETGHRTFLLSTIKATHFEQQAKRLGVCDAFEFPYVQVNDKREKIREILAIHNLNPAETAFVGDMVHDIETARHGGVISIALLTGFDPPEKLLPARPDMIIRDLPTLLRVLR
jgi:phosphoglycolate phosphatase-like HAD superfamily hydrolase